MHTKQYTQKKNKIKHRNHYTKRVYWANTGQIPNEIKITLETGDPRGGGNVFLRSKITHTVKFRK